MTSQTDLILLMIRDLASDVAAQHQLLVRLLPDTRIDGLSVSQYLTREKRASLERQILDIGDRDPLKAEQLRKILDSLPKD
jgi:hypothetical protein